MIFSNPTTKVGIVEDTYFLLNMISEGTVNYPIAEITRNINNGLDKMAGIVLQADGRWQWDDSNHTDLPIGTTDLVSGQRDYEITGAEFLRVTKVLVKDSSGNWKILNPIDENDQEARDLLEDKNTGTPTKYDKKGRSIFLDPKPNFSSTLGFKVHFQRDVHKFEITDTIAVPGFPAPFHRLLSLYAAKDYCLANSLRGKMSGLEPEIMKLEAGLLKFYSARNKDERIRIGFRQEDYGSAELGGGGIFPTFTDN